MALERETPRKPGGGAPDHHHHHKSCASPGASCPSSSSSGASASSSSASVEVSIGKRRGNQYVQGVPLLAEADIHSNGNKVIKAGFFWKDVPELEDILQRFMEEYYEMRYVISTLLCL